MFQMQDEKPRKRRNFNNPDERKNRKNGPKGPRHSRKEKHRVRPEDQAYDEFLDDVEEMEEVFRGIFGDEEDRWF